MIEKIDIPNFGSFKNFSWDTCTRNPKGNISKFKKLNILYGRNYSGKTTLSRIFRSLHTGKLPDKYDTPSFIIGTDTGTINQNQTPTSEQNIRVYNKDYIDDHLGFLRDNDGNITPFAIIGNENKIIEQKIKDIDKELGNAEDKTGLRYKHALKYDDFIEKEHTISITEKEIKTKLTKKATQSPNGIKHNPIYKDPNYDGLVKKQNAP